MNKNAQSGNNWYQMKLRLLREENNKLKESALNIFLRDQGLKIDDIVNIINFETPNLI